MKMETDPEETILETVGEEVKESWDGGDGWGWMEQWRRWGR